MKKLQFYSILTLVVLSSLSAITLYFSDNILEFVFIRKLESEIERLEARVIKKGAPRTPLELKTELAYLIELLEWGDTESNTEAFIKLLKKRNSQYSVQLALDVLSNSQFARHSHPSEELHNFAFDTAIANADLN